MGCACSREANGEKNRRDSKISEAEPGKKASKYAQIDDSTVSRQHDNSSGQAGENTSNTNNKSEKGGNLWGKFFDKKSKKDNTPLIAPNDTTVDPSILTAAQINLPDQSVISPDKSVNNSSKLNLTGGSQKSKLPYNTINLICCQNEFETASEKSSSNKLNREIQAYLSLPYCFQQQQSQQSSDELFVYSLKLFEKHFSESAATPSLPSIYDNLRIYCAPKPKNCDFATINLNYVACQNNSTKTTTAFNFAVNKYFRRQLSKLILADLLGTAEITSQNLTTSYLTAYGVFVIFLSESQVEQETLEDLLCPSQIDVNDFKVYLEKKLTKFELDLFNKWYKLDANSSSYRLDIDFNTYMSSPKALNDDLNKLTQLFLQQFDAIEDNGARLKLKYIKSVQQEELELISQAADPSTIVWVHVVGSGGCYNQFNKARYEQMFDLLKEKVLTHNYKHIKISCSDLKQTSTHLNLINEFLYNALKQLADAFIMDLDKSSIYMMPLRIDKHLAIEIHKHYQYYKYLRSCSILDANVAPLNQTENKYYSILNEYVSENSVSFRNPLLIYNNELASNETAYFDIFTSKWMRKLIESNRQIKETECKKIIAYRYCNHTILATEMVTLLQSLIHQLCYVVGVHESWAFENPTKIVENICKSLNNYFSQPDNKHKQIIIILNGLDRCLKSSFDLALFLAFVTKLYSSSPSLDNSSGGGGGGFASNLKLIITISSQPGSSSAKLVSSLLKKLESQYATQKPVCKLSLENVTRTSSSSLPDNSNNSQYLNDRLMSLLFATNSDPNFSNFVDLLLYFLNETRYGVKQSEIGDMFRMTNGIPDGLKNFLLDMTWFTVKYHSQLISAPMPSLLALCTDNSQVLFKLASNLGPFQLKRLGKANKFDETIYSYYNRSSSSGNASTPEIEKPIRLISFFNNRIFHELPKYFYLSDSNDPQEDQAYLNEFILNPKWLVNKTFTCSSILYFLHDLTFYRKLFMAEGGNADLPGSTPDEIDSTNDDFATMPNKKKFLRFERLVYKLMFNLNQDQNQLNFFIKNLSIEALLTNLNYLKKTAQLPKLVPLNFGNFKSIDKCMLDQENKNLAYFSKVVFIQKGIFLTLSDAPLNQQIKIWKMDQVEPIRTIKLNKSPKDIRLINHHTAVVLIERNLHLFDLNRCEHIYDLNSTMNPGFALFELHDPSHLVLLARNRLSVILMKVPHVSTAPQRKSSQHAAETADVSGKLNVSGKDDMFLFKVGEDRYLKSLIVSRNGKIMVCGDEVQKPFPLLVWDLSQRKLVHDLRQPNHEIIVSIQAISSSGRYFVSACQEFGESKNCLVLYDLNTGQLFKKLKARSDYICVEISEEVNVVIACLENSQLIVYELSNGSKKFSINSNRFPINKIKLFYSNKTYKNYFITYDTTGCDWTIRLWDLNSGDQLISSLTCPSRIISLDLNTSPFYLDHQQHHNAAAEQEQDYDIFMAVSLYGVKELMLVKLDNQNFKPAKLTISEMFSNQDSNLNGLQKEINL